jgi:hypothetical protein
MRHQERPKKAPLQIRNLSLIRSKSFEYMAYFHFEEENILIIESTNHHQFLNLPDSSDHSYFRNLEAQLLRKC